MIQFQLSNADKPRGELATLITAATDPSKAEPDWETVFAISDKINANPSQWSAEAWKAIKGRLESRDPVTLNHTLAVLDALSKNGGKEFAHQVASKDSQKFVRRFLERVNLGPENRGKMLEIIADWGTGPLSKSTPETRRFFEVLIKDGFKFSEASLAKLSPADLERLKPARTVRSVKAVTAYLSPTETLPVHAFAEVGLSFDSLDAADQAEWVHFECALAESCSWMLLDTVESSEESVDLTNNTIVKDAANRCKEVEQRISSLLARVHEPEMVQSLQTAQQQLNRALTRHNQLRLERDPHADDVPEPVVSPAAAPTSPTSGGTTNEDKLRSALKFDSLAISSKLKPMEFGGSSQSGASSKLGGALKLNELQESAKLKIAGHVGAGKKGKGVANRAYDPYGEKAGLLSSDDEGRED
ncbi:hypothetical protein CcCBS67573_g01799 [Chytriomyces confervae]|uniref:VHS domain-containing protein n=1 Tax=Chytriomyces confervae TaxID=246404 RepID=A0A507FKV9_9FUNG|nr:hypothetical protein CcCBS67573_g01799 [Chytriomyces confervae]